MILDTTVERGCCECGDIFIGEPIDDYCCDCWDRLFEHEVGDEH